MDHITQRQLFLKHVAQTSDTPLLGIDMNVVKANGVILTDVHGKTYIDLISGISVSNIGHCHPDVVKAIEDQVDKYMHLMVYGEFNQSPQVKYATLLTSVLPSALNSVYYTTGGSEAIEGAMKLAKRTTGRSEIISFKNAYHGSTQGALSLMGDESFKNAFRPLLPGIKQIQFNDEKDLATITNKTAAVVIELIQGEAGVRKMDKAYLQKLKKQCDENGVLLVVDEIQTGFGRTGSLFAFEQFGVVPDILCIAKGMGGGLPIGAFVADKELMQQLTHDPVLGHINTFGGNAVCTAAAIATLNVVLKNNLAKRANEIEQIIKQKLIHKHIKEVRVVGALGAVDMGNEELNFKFCKLLIESGVITDWFLFCSSAFRIAPPLTITNAELEKACDQILTTLDQL
ncbi:MAG: aspartate aminotransferase family protein [Sphingobacteriaceae bacterium]